MAETNYQTILNIFIINWTVIQVISSLEESSAWSSSSSTALCPGEAARQSQFQWRGEKLEVVCS